MNYNKLKEVTLLSARKKKRHFKDKFWKEKKEKKKKREQIYAKYGSMAYQEKKTKKKNQKELDSVSVYLLAIATNSFNWH